MNEKINNKKAIRIFRREWNNTARSKFMRIILSWIGPISWNIVYLQCITFGLKLIFIDGLPIFVRKQSLAIGSISTRIHISEAEGYAELTAKMSVTYGLRIMPALNMWKILRGRFIVVSFGIY